MFEEIARFGTEIAAIDEHGNNISYQELVTEGDKISQDIEKRSLVFSLCSNTIGSVCGYVGFLRNKIVPLLLSESLDDELLKHLIEIYQPAYIWLPSTKVTMFSQWNTVYEKYNYVLVKTQYESVTLYQELALLLTTSGSTGSPKLVRQSYENLQSNTESIIEYLELDSTERAITTLPMNYTYGLSIINTHLTAGATMLLTEKTLMQKEFWEFFKREEATSFGGVPYTYEMLNKLRFFRMQLPSLRYMTQAGGKLSPELHRQFAEFAKESGRKFIVMYGQTEATARMAYLPAEYSLEKYGSMGIAIPNGRFELWDVNQQVITEPGVAGELIYYGKNVTLGYAECQADLAKGDERQGRLETGDMAKMDEDGYFFIIGRKKRFLKVYGNRVNLDEIEHMLKDHFQEISCACSGVDDKVYVFIVGANATQVVLEEIKEFVSKKTGLNKNAFTVKSIPEIPKNDSGKTVYTELEKYY